jgi:hypothetical protein
MELALLQAARAATNPIPLPIVEVDFRKAKPFDSLSEDEKRDFHDHMDKVGVITSLEAPHRRRPPARQRVAGRHPLPPLYR